MSRAILLILGDQLFPPETWSPYRADPVVLIESRELCTHFKYHQQKIAFFLSSMRSFRDELRAAGHVVDYFSLEETVGRSFLDILGDAVARAGSKRLKCALVNDRFFETELTEWAERAGIEIEWLPTLSFLTSRARLRAEIFGDGSARPFMKRFYESQRAHFKILIDPKGKPVGGRWSFDTENRKKIPAALGPPSFPHSPATAHDEAVARLVEREFSDHPGRASERWLPTDRNGARAVLAEFIAERLESFGPYEDAIDPRSPVWFHSALSPLMNNGLLPPREVLDAILRAHAKGGAGIESVEGITRQIIGWREFIFGISRSASSEFSEGNFWGHGHDYPAAWWTASLGIPPLDDVLRKVERYGYAHHIERLMILSNFSNLLEVRPDRVYRWFMENFVDSADWVMGPNVFGMGLMSAGDAFVTKPYLCSSNYLLKMSSYGKGEWCEVVDALYWAFIEKHVALFRGHPRLGMMAAQLDKMPAERRARLEEVRTRAMATWYPAIGKSG